MPAALATAPALPVVLAFGAALCFAVGIQLSRLGLRDLDSQSGVLLTIGAACLIYWALSPGFVAAHFWTAPAVVLFAAIGLFRPVLSSNLAMAATARVGPTISATLSATAPLFGLGFGVLVLGEALDLPVAAGTLAIVAGVGLLAWSSGRPGGARAWPLWALALPLGAALIRVLAQGLAKIGMEALPSPLFVGLVGYTVSFAVAWANAWRRGQRVRGVVGAPGARWFYASGACYASAIFLLNTALLHGDLVVVSPIVACQPLFTLVLGYAVFRERTLDARVVLAVVVVAAGVVAITLR